MLDRPDLDTLERLREWLDDVQLSARLGVPTYANPGELKSDLRVLLATVETLTKENARLGALVVRLRPDINPDTGYGKAEAI